MPAFTYTAIDAAGRFVQGEIDGRHADEVQQRLKQLGYVPLETRVRAAATGRWARFFTFRRPVRQRELTIFLRELALVLHAGLALDEALQLLASEESSAIAAVARELRTAITGGASLAEAMGRFPFVFGPDLIAMIQVAEASGSLIGVLDSVAEARTRTEQLLDKVASALRYPAFLLAASLAVLTFFLTVVVPQFDNVITDFGSDGLVGLALLASRLLVENAKTIALGAAACCLLVLLALSRQRLRHLLKRRLMRTPGLRGIIELRRTVLFCGSIATLLGNGVSLTEALRVMVDLPGAWGEGLDQVAGEVRRGGRLVESLALVGYLPPIALRMLRVGEESGELATVARRTAEFYDTKLSRRLDTLAAIVGPAAIALMATIVGGLIVSILSALLSVNRMVS